MNMLLDGALSDRVDESAQADVESSMSKSRILSLFMVYSGFVGVSENFEVSSSVVANTSESDATVQMQLVSHVLQINWIFELIW